MLNFCSIAVAILKMVTVRNFSMSGAQFQHCPISTPFHMWVDYDVPNWFLTSKNFYWSPFSKWPPQYRTNSTLSDFNDISYVGRLWCHEMIPDIEKFLPVAIFKMVTTIPHKFNVWFLVNKLNRKLNTFSKQKNHEIAVFL
jgi:hypothetical protein